MKCTLREWQTMKKDIDDLIIQASVKDGSDSLTVFPIGMSWQYETLSDKVKMQSGLHDNLILCAINPTTDMRRRPHGINRMSILQNLKKNGIDNTVIDSKEYFSSLASYKFVISPEGNGLDCHRHYEALLAGCIPIVEFNIPIEDKYRGLPILYTKDYSEITSDFLNIVYDTMLDKIYDFSRLFKSYYSKEEQKLIDEYGFHWIRRVCPESRPDTYFNSIYGTPLVWITLINYGYINYTKNFLKSMEVHSCPFKLIVYCLDKKIIDELSEYKNAICFDASLFIKEEFAPYLTEWNTMDYKKICFSKLDAIKYTHTLSHINGIWAVGYIDTDIIVFKNPTDIFINKMRSDRNIAVFSQCDENSNNTECSNQTNCPDMCTGTMVFRTGSIDNSIFNYSDEDILKYSGDQHFLEVTFNKNQINRLTISRDILLNGAYPGLKDNFVLPESAYLIHYNWMIGSQKEYYMKKNSMWYL